MPSSRTLAPQGEKLDCTRCGACCCNPDENRSEGYVDYVEVEPRAALWQRPHLVKRLVVYAGDGKPHLRLDAGGRCVALRGALGRHVTCTIYELRPLGCRKVEAGGARCLQYRRERGIDRDRGIDERRAQPNRAS